MCVLIVMCSKMSNSRYSFVLCWSHLTSHLFCLEYVDGFWVFCLKYDRESAYNVLE